MVRHKAWGIGKVLFLTDTKAVVGFPACRTVTDQGLRDVSLRGEYLEPTSGSDPALDNWNITLDVHGRAVRPRLGVTSRRTPLKPLAAGVTISTTQAIARFMERYPAAFTDDRYVAVERRWRWEKHVEWHERVGTRSLAEMAETNLRQLAHHTMRVIQKGRRSLLDKAELAAFITGLTKDKPSRAYFGALDRVMSGADDDRAAITGLCDATAGLLGAGGAARTHAWRVVTAIPSLARPDRFMFLKPTVIRKGVDRLGLCWHYEAEPNAATYRDYLALGRTLFDALRSHGAQDLIDVQSFLSVIGE